MSIAYTLISWGVTVVLILGAIHVYNPALTQKLIGISSHVPPQLTNDSEVSTTKRPKAKKVLPKQDSLKTTSGTENLSGREVRTSKKRKIVAPPSGVTTQTVEKSNQNEDDGYSTNDSDFAQQLKKAQSGTKLQSQAQAKASASNQKVEKTKEVDQSGSISEDEGGDDEESKPSTALRNTSSSRDISDMLEAPAAGPATLRLTNIPTESKQSGQPKKKFEEVQSKKKRNEQKRREEQKREVEESNQLWEKKKQEQLRTARMAAGTSTQIKANNFTNTANAWQKKPQTSSNEENKVSMEPLLDTFEMASSKGTASSVQTASMNSIASKPMTGDNVNALRVTEGDNKTSALGASGRERAPVNSLAHQFSEEEQIKQFRDQDKEETWEAVTSKKTKKKTKAEADTSSDTSSVPPPVRSTFPEARTSNGKINGVNKPKEESNRFSSIQISEATGLKDDEWAA